MTQLVRFNSAVPSFPNREEFLTPFSTLFDELFNDFIDTRRLGENVRAFKNTSYPKVDIIDEPDKVVIEAEIPGLTKDQVSVELEKGVLRIKGEKKEETEDKKRNYVHRELKHSSFCRSFTVGENVNTGSVSAKYENGVLEVVLQKLQSTPEKDVVKKIQIE